MALCKPLACLVGTPSFRQILQQKPKTDLVFLNFVRTRIGAVKKSSDKTKFFSGSAKSDSVQNAAKSKDSFSKGLLEPRNSKIETVENTIHVENNPITPGILWRPFLFTVAFSATSIGGCAIWQYENIRKKSKRLLQIPAAWAYDKFKNQSRKHLEWRQKMNDFWNNLTEADKVFIPLCLANVVVFLGWRVKRFQPAMVKYFCSNPGSKVLCWPMVLSTFSHYNFLHLGLNMYVLYTFSGYAIHVLGKEQFIGLYMSSGVVSSFASLMYKTITKQAALSMGASGAIMAVLGYVCSHKPDIELQIIFLPFFTFYAMNGLKCLMAFDTAGMLFGWKFFDHAAHIGGALSGISWFYWGNQYIWKKREPLLVWWHELRNGVEK